MDIYGNEAYNIRQVLEKLTNIHWEMLEVMKKPENPVIKTLQIIALVAGALTIVHIIDIIRSWF